MHQIFIRTILPPLDRVAEELDKNLDDEMKKELEEESESFFIPFPGTTKEVRPRPYRGSDPEWEEFIKFSRNPALGKRVRDELAEHIRMLTAMTPGVTLRCGKEIVVRRYWLDVDFPTSPPPEFERSGIEIGDDFIAWSTMPVDSLTVFRIRQALWPSAVTMSMWSWWKVLLSQDPSQTAGWPSPSETKGIPGMPSKGRPLTLDEFVSKNYPRQSSKDPGKTDDSVKDENAPQQPSLQDIEEYIEKAKQQNQALKLKVAEEKRKAANDRIGNKTDLPKTSSLESGNAPAANPQENPYLIGLKLHALRAYVAFKQKFAQTWRPAPNYPPRGSILVSGLVELEAPLAWIVVDVKAAWDPKTKSYDSRSMQMMLRRLQMKRQGPIGGR